MEPASAAVFKITWPPFVALIGGTVATATLEIDPNVIYPILGACAVAIWRFASFVKGVQDAIKAADSDRKEMASTIEEIRNKQIEQGTVITSLSARWQAANSGGGSFRPTELASRPINC